MGHAKSEIVKTLRISEYTVANDLYWMRNHGELDKFEPGKRCKRRLAAFSRSAQVRKISLIQLRERLIEILDADPSLIDAVLDDGVSTGCNP